MHVFFGDSHDDPPETFAWTKILAGIQPQKSSSLLFQAQHAGLKRFGAEEMNLFQICSIEMNSDLLSGLAAQPDGNKTML